MENVAYDYLPSTILKKRNMCLLMKLKYRKTFVEYSRHQNLAFLKDWYISQFNP